MRAPEPDCRHEQGIETIEWAIFSLVVAVLGTLAWKVAGAVTQAGLIEIF